MSLPAPTVVAIVGTAACGKKPNLPLRRSESYKKRLDDVFSRLILTQ